MNVLVSVEEGSLPNRVFEWSSTTGVCHPSLSSILIGDSILSSVCLSDSSSSSIEGEPLSPVPWLMGSDSEPVLTVSSIFG